VIVAVERHIAFTPLTCLLARLPGVFLAVACVVMAVCAVGAEKEEITRVACPSCGECIGLESGTEAVKCKCGTAIDAKALLARKAEHLRRFEQVSPAEAKTRGCLSCHKDIGVISPKMSFIRSIGGTGKRCVVCHEGDAEAHTRATAHRALIPNPGNMWIVAERKGCGKCHGRNGTVQKVTSRATGPLPQGNHVYRVERSLMSTTMGILNNTLAANGLLPVGVRKYANLSLREPPLPRRVLKLVHRVLGWVFVAGYVAWLFVMAPLYLANGPMISLPYAIHAYLGCALFVLLLVKLCIVWFFKKYYAALPVLGYTVYAAAFLVVGFSGSNDILLWLSGPNVTVKAGTRDRSVSAALGRDVLCRKCAHCRELDRVYLYRKSEEEWRLTVKRMRAKDSGLISRDQADHIVGFLASELGRAE